MSGGFNIHALRKEVRWIAHAERRTVQEGPRDESGNPHAHHI